MISYHGMSWRGVSLICETGNTWGLWFPIIAWAGEGLAWHTVRFVAQFAAWRQHSRGPDAFSDWRVLGRMVHNWCSEPKQYSHENSVMLGFLYVYLEPAPHPPVSRGLFHKQPSKMGCLIFSFNYFSFVFTNFTDFFSSQASYIYQVSLFALQSLGQIAV